MFNNNLNISASNGLQKSMCNNYIIKAHCIQKRIILCLAVEISKMKNWKSQSNKTLKVIIK